MYRKRISANFIYCIIAVTSFIAINLTSLAVTNYYVSTNGIDFGNNGMSLTSSWRTIEYAVQNVASGDVINVDAGEYVESVIYIRNSITITGTNLYIPSNPPFSKHVSRTIIKPYYINNPDYPILMYVLTNAVTIQNLTIEGDGDSNGTPDIAFGIYSTNKPLNVNHCVIGNIKGYGISCYGRVPVPSTNDDDTIRSYFGYNLITNITATNEGTATAIYLNNAPSSCEFNEIGIVSGNTANAGIYVIRGKYTSKTENWLQIKNNCFDQCTTAIWANEHGGTGEKIILASNTINNGLIGIRITAAKGQALVFSNDISVSGISPSTNATPACGIWIQADMDPWGMVTPLMQTDHLVSGNRITGSSTNADGTIGMLFAYDTTTTNFINNGVRATVLNNTIAGFDYGAYIRSGTNEVGTTNDPLVRIVLHTNDFDGNISYGLFATGVTEMVNASNNWWGYYFGPTGTYGNAVTTNVLFSWPLGGYWRDINNNGTNDWLDTDDDGDTLLDTNEMAIGTSPALWDTDGDHMGDYDEIIAGTDPLDRLSVLLRVYETYLAPNSNWFVFSWQSATGKKYRIYRTTNLITGFSTPIATNILPNYPLMNTYTDKNISGSGSYFYRITETN
ncbi:MAG: thrombospondin type 3 repeat-containing protein [Kiritimatiellae bacterium]|nr:thrombospondin type 3 repeat-containing protein [Kiritimatiellia bacterium]MDD5522874.1 thrombospondin type 3 repeat-containing protein [Kiritimatiellia bacterium]